MDFLASSYSKAALDQKFRFLYWQMSVKIENSRNTGDVIIGRPQLSEGYLIDVSVFSQDVCLTLTIFIFEDAISFFIFKPTICRASEAWKMDSLKIKWKSLDQ